MNLLNYFMRKMAFREDTREEGGGGMCACNISFLFFCFFDIVRGDGAGFFANGGGYWSFDWKKAGGI